MNLSIIQNLIVDNAGYGIAWSLVSGGYTLVFYNTIARNGAAAIYANGHDTTRPDCQQRRRRHACASRSALRGMAFLRFIEHNDFYAPTGQTCVGLVTNLAGTNGNISANPLFACAPALRFRLLPGSPCIDTALRAIPSRTCRRRT